MPACTAGRSFEITDFVSFLWVYFFRKRRTSCDCMFSAALMLAWLMFHWTSQGTNTVMTCLSDAAGQRRRRCTCLVARGALRSKWRRRREGAAGACEGRGAGRGKILTITQINAPTDTQTHLGELMTERVSFILKYWFMKKKCGSSRKGTFLIQGKRAGAWAPLGLYLCTCLLFGIVRIV